MASTFTIKNITRTFIALAVALSNIRAMERRPTDTDLSEVFRNQKLHIEFENKKLFLIESVIKKDTTHVEAILKNAHYKVAAVLANHIHQHCTYVHMGNLKPHEKVSPLEITINPFFEGLTPEQKDDLDVATPLNLAVFLNDTPTFKVLLAYKAQINASHGLDGYSPLHIAIKHNQHNSIFNQLRGRC